MPAVSRAQQKMFFEHVAKKRKRNAKAARRRIAKKTKHAQ
jgi:ribosomal protein S21